MLRLLPPPSIRRALRVAGVVALVVVAYVGGVVTGVVGSGDRPASSRGSGVIDEAADRIAAKAAHPVQRKALERAAVEGMLRELGDKWSTYYGPSQYASFKDALDGHYAGVGLWLRPDRTGAVAVASVQDGSPAAQAGLQTGDVIESVAAQPVDTADVGQVATLLRGRPGTVVRLVVRRGGVDRGVALARTTVTTDDVVVEHLHGDITRVQVRAFTRGVGADVRRAVAGRRAGGAAAGGGPGGIVLDLRDDPGGLLDEAVDVASAFLDGGPVVSYERRGRPARTLDAMPGGDVTTPLVVLVNGSTASAAEVVAAALQDRNRAVVVGSRTFGKGTVQEPSRLSDGSAIELTVGRYLTPAGRALDGVGVEPDVAVPTTAAPELAERRAIEVLTGLVAALGAGGKG